MTTALSSSCPRAPGAAYSAAPSTQEPSLSESPDTSPDRAPEPDLSDVDRVGRGIRWSRIVAIVVLVATVSGAYLFNEWRKTNALRVEVLTAYDRAVRAYRRPLVHLDDAVADRVVAAAKEPWRGDSHDPIFRVSALTHGQGIYVRLPRDAAGSRDAVRRAARKQHSDAIGGCLAVNPALYGRLLVLGEIVAPEFRKKILEADSVTRLRALDQDFVLRAQRDLPHLAEVLRPDWMLLVLEGGAARAEVHLWDLHRGRELLRLRPNIEAEVVNVRWQGRGVVPSKMPADPTVTNTIQDCAIASAIRERSGETLTTIGGPLSP